MPLSASMMEGVALCNFNQLYKMDPSTVQAWAGALRRLGPGASLWLSRVSVRRDSSKVAEVKLTREAAALGVVSVDAGKGGGAPVEECSERAQFGAGELEVGAGAAVLERLCLEPRKERRRRGGGGV